MRELLCAFFFYHAAQRTCAVPTSVSRDAGSILQDAPGYSLFGVSPGSAVGPPSPSSDVRRCPAGTTAPRGCWKSIGTYGSHVSVGPAGVWVATSNHPYAKLETYGNPLAEGAGWARFPHNQKTVQLDIGTDIVWMVRGSGALAYRSGITSDLTSGDAWVAVAAAAAAAAAAAGYRWVSVSPQGATWAVTTDGALIHLGLSAGGGGLAGNVSTVGAVSLRSVDAGAAGVWAVDDAGRLLHRLGTYGQDGVPGTGWRQVGSGVFRSVSSGRDLAVAVDSAGHVWLSAASDPSDAPTGLGWVWLGGGLAQAELYQSTDVTVMWATSDQDLFFFIL